MNTSSKELNKACKFACDFKSDIHQLPFQITEYDLLKAIQSFQSLPTNSITSMNNIKKN